MSTTTLTTSYEPVDQLIEKTIEMEIFFVNYLKDLEMQTIQARKDSLV